MEISKVDTTVMQYPLKQAKSAKLKEDVLIWTIYTGGAYTTICTERTVLMGSS
jgi:hypothetical protein